MELFKLQVSGQVTPRGLETTIASGPFLVEAEHERWARILVSMNYSIAVSRPPGEMIPTFVWSDLGANDCVKLGNVDHRAVQQRLIFQGTDFAPDYLDHPVLLYEGKQVARMVWWPCRPSERCPM